MRPAHLALALWGVSALLGASALLGGGCKQQAATVAAGDGLVGLRIPAHQGLPALEVAVQTRPKVADPLVANTVATLLSSAFVGCISRVDVKKSFPLQLEFSSQGGRLETLRKGAGPLEQCLFAALAGKPLAGWQNAVRARLQIRPLQGAKK